jgi:Uma2 family endonuclease
MEALSGRILLEEGFAEELQEAEIDLLDDYAHKRLTVEERAGVERYLLISPLNRERVLMARALRQSRG